MNRRAFRYHMAPRWNASPSTPDGSRAEREYDGLTTGDQCSAVELFPPLSHLRIRFHTTSQASMGAYRPVTNWLSLVVATNTGAEGCSKRIGDTPVCGRPYTAVSNPATRANRMSALTLSTGT